MLGELAPTRLAIQRNAQFAYVVAPVLHAVAWLMRPFIWLLSKSSDFVVRLLGGDPHKTTEELSDEELRDIVSTHGGLPDDEYGGTGGIVTLEDLVEEVVGEIFDEYDTEVAPDELAAEGGLVDGRLNLQDFEEVTGITVPRGSSDTVAGLVVETLGRLAKVGDVVELPGAVIQVAAMDRRRIAQLLVTPVERSAEEQG